MTFKQWCLDGGLPPASKAILGRDLRAAHPEIKRSRVGPLESRVPAYAGITNKKDPGNPGNAGYDIPNSRDSLGNNHCRSYEEARGENSPRAPADNDPFSKLKDPHLALKPEPVVDPWDSVGDIPDFLDVRWRT